MKIRLTARILSAGLLMAVTLPAQAEIELQTSINDVFVRGTNELAGSITMNISPEDFADSCGATIIPTFAAPVTGRAPCGGATGFGFDFRVVRQGAPWAPAPDNPPALFFGLQGSIFSDSEHDIVKAILHSIFQDTMVSVQRKNQIKIFAGAEQVIATGQDCPSPLLPGTCPNTTFGARGGLVVEQREINFTSAENLGGGFFQQQSSTDTVFGGFVGAEVTHFFDTLDGPGSAQPFIRGGVDVLFFADGDQSLTHFSQPFGLLYQNNVDATSISFEVNLEIGIKMGSPLP